MSLAAAVAAQGFAVITAPDLVRAAPSDPWAVAASLAGEPARMLERQPIRAVKGGQTFASGHGPAPLHTDSQLYRGMPAHWQALFCVQAARQGGDTVLLDTRAVLAATQGTPLFDALFDVSRHLSFVFGNLEGPTIARAGDTVVFTGTPRVEDDVGRALVPIYERLPKTTLKLQPGEVLVVDNHRMLHGRTGFEGPRMLERILVWLTSPAPADPWLFSRARARLDRPLDRADVVLPDELHARAIVSDMLRGVPPGVLATRHSLSEPLLYVLRDRYA
ncbi:MAG: TauD/TfdA family dioxygenase [Myxococcales bacterium]|nr:TauD/TfdA family dioxygenase [Myxococcales bacterium]